LYSGIIPEYENGIYFPELQKYYMWENISDADALGLKPAGLPEVEPELQIPPPRPMVWQYPESSPNKISPEMENLLTHGIAVRGWKTLYRTRSEIEGTEHYMQYCFQADDSIIQGKNFRSYDDLHLAIESPDYAIWLANAFHREGSFTILYEKGNPVRHEIFGHLELFIRMDLKQITEKICSTTDPCQVDRLAYNFLKISISPLWNIGENSRQYFSLMEKIGLANMSEVHDSDTNLIYIKEVIPAGDYDKEVLEELSELCKSYVPGIWAAR
jgi:hypothetical protein